MSEDVQDIFWTFYVCSIYVLCPGGIENPACFKNPFFDLYHSPNDKEMLTGKNNTKNRAYLLLQYIILNDVPHKRSFLTFSGGIEMKHWHDMG